MIRVKDSAAITDVIDFPCIITDKHDRILCWYFPEILDALENELTKSKCKPQDPSRMAGVTWRADLQYFRKAEDCEIPPGIVTFAPVWHEAGKPQPKYPPVVGAAWRDFQATPQFRAWVRPMLPFRDTFSFVAALCYPLQLIQQTKCERRLREDERFKDCFDTWTYPGHGLAIISNRQTPLHRDRKTSTGMYDLLATCGKYNDGDFMIEELGLRLRYKSGTMIGLAGGLLRHGAEVGDGERVAFASFMRQELMEAVGIECSSLAHMKSIADDVNCWIHGDESPGPSEE
ncbi:hypothetical protein BDW22DRAFT_1326555 [Trametopsis cervina]|nr:hypothetical protein BDW22DRAFT_1326555 [Trametopsis cervina]